MLHHALFLRLMPHYKSIALLVWFCVLLAGEAWSQKQVETQHLLWARYYLRVKLNDTYQLRQEWEERAYWFPWRQHQWVSRTHVERKLAKGWQAGLGFTYFLQSLPHDPRVKGYTNQVELRPQLELGHRQALADRWALHHRYWGEFRFFEALKGGFAFGNVRLRYKAELRYTPRPRWTVRAFNEVHLNLGRQIVHNVFDQNRLGGSVQYLPWDHWGFELGYFNWFQQRRSGLDFYNRHIVRVTVHHLITFHPVKKS